MADDCGLSGLARARFWRRFSPLRRILPSGEAARSNSVNSALLSAKRTRAAAAFVLLPCAMALASCGEMAQRQEARLMLQTLVEAPSHGFSPERFSVEGLAEQLQTADAQAKAAAVERLHALIIGYAEAQRGVAPRPRSLNRYWGMQPPRYDAETEFNGARRTHRLQAWLASLPPPQQGYRALRSAYATYARIADEGGWPSVPAGDPPAVGSNGPQVQALRERLAFEDRRVARVPRTAPFDAGLMRALSAFQVRHGLAATAEVDRETLTALNVPASDRVEQIRASMARWRWAPRTQAASRIDVNIATGLADIYLNNRRALHMRVAVGRRGDETPLLASQLDSVVLNPTWSVPASIATNELFPREQRDPGYLERNHFTVVDTEDPEEDEGGFFDSWFSEEPQQTGRLVQQPGPGNALGRVKFVFDSPYAVYLHDTPSRAAFALDQRTVSHGCVRLERAVDLARLLLSREGWTDARIDDVLAAGETVTAPLTHPVAVNVFYWTAFVEGNQVSFRNDVYGWDRPLLAALDAAPRRRIAAN